MSSGRCLLRESKGVPVGFLEGRLALIADAGEGNKVGEELYTPIPQWLCLYRGDGKTY